MTAADGVATGRAATERTTTGTGGGAAGDGGPRVAVAPAGTRDWICDVITDAGGVLTDVDAAEALVWTDAAEGDADAPTALKRLVDEHPRIRWVQLPWAGVEPYTRAGVFTGAAPGPRAPAPGDGAPVFTCGKGVYARPVAEHALALALAGLRDLKRFTLARDWGEQAGISLHGGRVTIFGGGGIAEELVSLLRPFGCAVTVVRRRSTPMEGVERVLDFSERYEALKGADVVFLALALTDRTRGLISSIELELMEPAAWLVNVARGEHVVTEDLVVALRDDTIGGAALDVTDPEPLPEGHPLWSLPNCIVTPHTGNTEDMAKPLLAARVRENLRRFAAGEPLLGPVDPDLGY